jgi:hypothetical protein
MILYSVMPSEIVFGNINNENGVTDFKEITYMGEKVQVSPLTNNRFMIQRIISTKPDVFLKAGLQPGTIIEARL